MCGPTPARHQAIKYIIDSPICIEIWRIFIENVRPHTHIHICVVPIVGFVGIFAVMEVRVPPRLSPVPLPAARRRRCSCRMCVSLVGGWTTVWNEMHHQLQQYLNAIWRIYVCQEFVAISCTWERAHVQLFNLWPAPHKGASDGGNLWQRIEAKCMAGCQEPTAPSPPARNRAPFDTAHSHTAPHRNER